MDKKGLKELSMSNLDRVLKALNEGNIGEAKKRVKIMERDAKHIHDTMVNFAWILLTYIGEKYGDEEVIKALRFRHDYVEQDQKRMRSMSPEEAVRHKTMIHRGHHSRMTLTEEKDRFVLKLDPCNTGGRLLREVLKKYKGSFGRMKKAYPESWSRKDVSYYCVHCAQNVIVNTERGGDHPLWIYERSPNSLAPCYQYYYKKREGIPEKFLAQVGLRKGSKKAEG